MIRRDRHDIAIEILKMAKSPMRKTDIMKNVSLSYKQTTQYLGILLDKELLEIDKTRRLTTTKEGIELLERCSECPLFKWKTQKAKIR